MFKLPRFIDDLFLSIVAIAGLLFSLADLLGLLPSLGGRLPMLTLLLVSLAMASVSRIQHKCISMHKDIQHLLSEIELAKLARIIEQIDPNLRKVLEDDYFLDVLDFFQEAVREQSVHVDDWARFCHYFVLTLELFPKTTFLAVSTAITSDLWQNPMIVDAMDQFIKSKGKIKLVFFLKDTQALALPGVQTVLAGLETIGAQVEIVFNALTPNELKKNFIVESKEKIGWEIQFDGEGSVTTSVLTTNQEKTASYRKVFEKLRGNNPHKFGVP
jgi:hypothetical protein